MMSTYQEHKPWLLGLTGGIGVGKSTVACFFAQQRVKVLYADQIVHQLLEPRSIVYTDLVQHFGSAILDPDGSIDRSALRRIMLQDPKAKVWLETYLHPKVWKQLIQEAKTATSPYAVLEVPLLIEKNYVNKVDRVLLVEAPFDIRIQRIQSRDQMPVELIQQMMSHQASPNLRRQYAHDIIENNGSLASLKKQVQVLHQRYFSITPSNLSF